MDGVYYGERQLKAVVFTLGCKVNECESDALASGLKERGYEVTDALVPADLYIVNTCAVTKEAEKKSRQMQARIKRLNPDAKVIFTGCACQKDAAAFTRKNPNNLVTGVFNKNAVLDLLDKSGDNVSDEKKEYEELPTVTSFKSRAFVKVEDGCDYFCTYCIIPYLRGRARSRNPESVAKEIEKIKPLETVITGINLSAYNYNGEGLTGLIKRLKPLRTRIRLSSLEVGVITEEFLEELKGLYDFAPHFHLSLQSGSNATLKKMNRRYTAEEFLVKVDLIRKHFENAGITTDIIAGFPTETEENFEETVDLVKKVGFSDIHPFTFSKREGTVAYKMQDLPLAVKKERTERLLKLKAECKARFTESQKGKKEELLCEYYKDGYTEGYSKNYIRLYVKGRAEGIKKVVIGEPFRDGAIAEIIDN